MQTTSISTYQNSKRRLLLSDQIQTKKYYAEFYDEYIGCIDYYTGHSHIDSRKNLIGCITLSIPINCTESQSDLRDMLIGEFEQSEYDFMDEYNPDKREQIDNSVMNLLKTFGTENPNAKWDSEPIPENYDGDYPVYLIVVHIYNE